MKHINIRKCSYATVTNSADEPVESEGVFRLINPSGDDVSPGEKGLLLYKGGTVCTKSSASTESYAHAICREMGYTLALRWQYGYLHDRTFQRRFDVKLTKVEGCSDEKLQWKYCSFSTTADNTCHHDSDLILTCSGRYFPYLQF